MLIIIIQLLNHSKVRIHKYVNTFDSDFLCNKHSTLFDYKDNMQQFSNNCKYFRLFSINMLYFLKKTVKIKIVNRK